MFQRIKMTVILLLALAGSGEFAPIYAAQTSSSNASDDPEKRCLKFLQFFRQAAPSTSAFSAHISIDFNSYEPETLHFLYNKPADKIENYSAGDILDSFKAEGAQITGPQVSRIIKSLQTQRFIFTEKDPTDNRLVRVSLTRNGIDIAKRYRIFLLERVRSEIQSLSRVDFEDILSEINAARNAEE